MTIHSSKSLKLWFVAGIGALVLAAAFFVRAYADEPAKGSLGTGAYVEDPAVPVPANAYTTFSTVYNGHRYYLGVDTVAAKAPTNKDTVTYYDSPNYACIWQVGPLWSPDGTILANKDYTRTVKSVWLAEQVSRARYLAVGAMSAGYSPLLLTVESGATMWHTAKDVATTNRYINGYLYSLSIDEGLETYRYLSYDAVYGFSRLREARPASSQRISVWDRKTGSDLLFDITPHVITLGYEPTNTQAKYPVTVQAVFYEDIDRFRSRYDQTDVYARRSTPITDQATLVNPSGVYKLTGYYEWKSNQTVDPSSIMAYDGNSAMQCYTITGIDNSDPDNPVEVWGWRDSVLMHVNEKALVLGADNYWHDTVYAVGRSPIDNPERCRFLQKPAGGGAPTEGTYTNHADWLYVCYSCKGVAYKDSVLISRQTFHEENFTTLATAATPTDHVFPYSYNNKLSDGVTAVQTADVEHTFTISALYRSGYEVLAVYNAVAESYVGEERPLAIATIPGRYENEIWYDTLLVEAVNVDGTSCTWVESITLPARNQIKVRISQFATEELANRVAQIRFTYRYWHSSAAGDQATATSVIWITQEGKAAHDAELYSFSHADGSNALQAVHEKKSTFYAIPGENLSLPLHRDMWGYYRWFIYDAVDASKHERDLEFSNIWDYPIGAQPRNARGGVFMPINPVTNTSSRGRWDVIKDANNPGNTYFGADHFTVWTATPVPAIAYPESNSKTGKVACDVSEYYNIGTTGVVGNLTALTEPTLSYRHIFDIQPAKTRADQMATIRGNGNGDNWLETHQVVAPAAREFRLQPQCPISAVANDDVNEEHLQYIYYFNPDAAGTTDNDMGIKDSEVADTQAACYARIGKKYQKTSVRTAKLLTASSINAMSNDSVFDVLIVNAHSTKGYVLGYRSNSNTPYYNYGGFPSSVTDTATLLTELQDNYLNPSKRDSYILRIKKTANGQLKLYHASNTNHILSLHWRVTRWMNWTEEENLAVDLSTINFENDNTTDNILSKSNGKLFKLYFDTYAAGHCVLTGSTVSRSGTYTNSLHFNENGESERYGAASNQAWMIWQIIEPKPEYHFETPRWERSTNLGSTWTQVAHWNYDANNTGGASVTDVTGYSMEADGSLVIRNSVHPNPNETIMYRLRTEHFQLARFTVLTRPAETEILKNGGDIITQEQIDNEYTIIYKLDMEDWPAPGTSEVVAYNYHFPWDFTELGYHYPVGSGTDEVPADRRVFNTDMPGKGEYAFINKFVVPEGPSTQNPGEVYECMAGAEHGYMLCVNSGSKRTTIMNFDYNQLSCSGQQIYLVGNYCNPVDNSYEPQITADLEGTNDGITWTPIYRYKSGKIPFKSHDNNPWCQMALPIARDKIEPYKRFRCRAEINGAPYRNCHLLIDRLRFIERTRPFTVFQNKASCVSEQDSIVALIRLNYHSDTTLYKPGKLVAYQFQMWKDTANGGAGGYVPMLASKKVGSSYVALDGTTTPKLQVYPGYIKDAFTATEGVTKDYLKSEAGNDYGYVMIPEKNYDPNASNTGAGQSALRGALIDQALTKLGITGSDAATRKANFLNETGNVRNFEEVVTSDYHDFGMISYGGIETPHIKSFVKEGDDWVLYIVTRLPVKETDNNTFRIGMAVMNNLNDRPTFAENSCATFRLLPVKQKTSLLVDGSPWPNYTRAQIEADPAKNLLPANETSRASILLTVPAEIADHRTSNPTCKFDLLHATADVRNDNDAWLAKYGMTRGQFFDDMQAFRKDDEDNTLRAVTDWSLVRPADFMGTGRTAEVATAIYNRLNGLITAGVLELGLDFRDIYMGDRKDSYFYLMPIPATGMYTWEGASSAGTDTIIHASACNDSLWLELHSEEPQAKLRFGYDSRVGDTYIVPAIRASRTDANEHLKVRLAEISTTDPGYAVILGWEATELIESNAPDWTAMKTFKYHQDKDMRGHTPNAFDYYNIGDTIIFSPQASGNNISLKPGYWYRFKAPFYTALNSAEYTTDPSTPAGHSQFTVYVAPDTVRWTPEYADEVNYWNDDHNWMPIINGANFPEAHAKVPMGDTRVIIPQSPEGMLPIVADIVEHQVDTLEFGYAKNTCKEILFKAKSQMLGQEKLTYSRAFVDVLLTSGSWQTFSPALEHIYAGDMYVPANPATSDANDWAPGMFTQGVGSSWSQNPRVWPYAVYQGFYNATVPMPYYNSDVDGLPVNDETTATSKNAVDWVQTPALDMAYKPGKACVLNAYGPSDEDGEEITVRLPKQESAYYGYGKNPDGENYIAGSVIPMQTNGVNRPAFASLNKNLAYDKTSLGASDGIEYTLTNAVESKFFFFGNPTISLIDVYKLCVDNADQLELSDGKHQFTAYQLVNDAGTNYTAKTITGPGQYFVGPQRAVGLVANATNTAAKSLTIKLKPSAMVAITGAGTIVNAPGSIAAAPRRQIAQETEPDDSRFVYIVAANEVTDEWGGTTTHKAYLTLGENASAHAGYIKGEDAPSLSSGIHYYNDESFSTPLSLYTIADNQALMLDMRDSLSMVPLVFTTLDDHYTYSMYTMLTFGVSGQWNKPLYLHDALTGDSIMIINGLQLGVETPQADQLRYFINGYRAPKHTDIATGIDEVNGGEQTSNPLTSNPQTIIYDLLGRKMCVLDENQLISNIQLPTGVYVLQRGEKTERIVIR